MPSYFNTLTISRQDSTKLKKVMEEIGNEVVCRSKGVDPKTKLVERKPMELNFQMFHMTVK